MVTATVTKMLHRYGCTVTETMRFCDKKHAEEYRDLMEGRYVGALMGSDYTVVSVQL